MPEIKVDQALLFVAFLLPGFVSISIYQMRLPNRELLFKDQVLEAFSFSLINFAIVIWPIYKFGWLADLDDWWLLEWFAILLGFVVIPFALGWYAATLRNWAGRRGLLPASQKTAFDWAFSDQQGCWLKIRMNDGTWVGGKFDKDSGSFASASPDPGHLYIGESWALDANGDFIERHKDAPGLILKPSEYMYLLVYNKKEMRNDQ